MKQRDVRREEVALRREVSAALRVETPLRSRLHSRGQNQWLEVRGWDHTRSLREAAEFQTSQLSQPYRQHRQVARVVLRVKTPSCE